MAQTLCLLAGFECSHDGKMCVVIVGGSGIIDGSRCGGLVGVPLLAFLPSIVSGDGVRIVSCWDSSGKLLERGCRTRRSFTITAMRSTPAILPPPRISRICASRYATASMSSARSFSLHATL